MDSVRVVPANSSLYKYAKPSEGEVYETPSYQVSTDKIDQFNTAMSKVKAMDIATPPGGMGRLESSLNALSGQRLRLEDQLRQAARAERNETDTTMDMVAAAKTMADYNLKTMLTARLIGKSTSAFDQLLKGNG